MITIQSDSRKIKPGDTFIAVKCEINDGHQYIQDAIDHGAVKVVVEQPGEYGVETEVVSNTNLYLKEYLKDHYNQYLEKMNIIGITGTNGKTTTAMLLHDALNLLGEKTAYIGTIGFYMKKKIENLNNTTVELCNLYDLLIRAYDRGCVNVIMEVSSHALENGRCETIDFNMALFTNLTEDHLDEHGTMENYAYAKQKLFQRIKASGKAFINIDSKYHDVFLLPQNQNVTFGFQSSDYQILDYTLSNHGTKFQYQEKQNVYSIQTRLLGKYNIYNLIAMIAVLREKGISIEQLESVIPKLKAPVGRMDTILYGTNSIIIDYAHTPDAFENIFSTVREFQKGNIYVVFGCTGDRERKKRSIMTQLVNDISNYFIITNDDPHTEDPTKIVNDMIRGLKSNRYEVCIDRKKAIQKGIDLLKENDILLILGKGHEEFMIIGREKIPFNDKTEVLKYLEEK